MELRGVVKGVIMEICDVPEVPWNNTGALMFLPKHGLGTNKVAKQFIIGEVCTVCLQVGRLCFLFF